MTKLSFHISRSDPVDTGYCFSFLSEPLEVANEWNVSTDPMYSGTANVENVGVSLSVAAEVFDNCIKVAWPTDEDYDCYFIYAPGVGLVKNYHDEIYGNHTYELTSYTISN